MKKNFRKRLQELAGIYKKDLIKDDVLEGHTINGQTITRTEPRTCICSDCD